MGNRETEEGLRSLAAEVPDLALVVSTYVRHCQHRCCDHYDVIHHCLVDMTSTELFEKRANIVEFYHQKIYRFNLCVVLTRTTL